MTNRSVLHGKTFRQFALKGIVFAAPQFALMLFSFVYVNYEAIARTLRSIKNNIPTQEYVYCMLGDSTPTVAYYLPLIAAVLGAAFGILMFYFLDSKRMMTVYYGLGMKRTTLFRTVYLAGTMCSFLSIAVPLLLNCTINIAMLGNTAILWSTTAYYFLVLFGMNMLGYTLSALCTAGTGTILESAIDTLGILSIPFLMPQVLALLSRRFLNGSAINMPITPMLIEKPFTDYSDIPDGVIYFIPDKFNPFITMQKVFVNDYDSLIKGDKPHYVWNTDGTVFAVIFISVLVAVLAVCAVHVFAHRKAEYCNIPGANKTLNILGNSILGFYILCLTATIFPLKSAFLSVIIAVILFTGIFLALNALTQRGFKKSIKNWKQVFIPVSVTAVLLLIFSSGMFGYSSYIPKADEIKSARVTSVYPEGRGNINVQTIGTRYSRASGSYTSLGFSYLRNVTRYAPDKCSYYDETEIRSVLNLHEMLAESKGYKARFSPFEPIVSRDIAISYTLKNGKTVTRYFRNCDDKAFDALCLMQNNNFYKKDLSDWLKKHLTDSPDGKPDFSVCSRFMTGEKFPELTDEEALKLYNAVEKDIKKQTSEERIFPQEAILGFICQDSTSSYSRYEGEVLIDEGVSHLCVPYLTITADMVNTINILREFGLGSVFESVPNIKRALVIDEKNSKHRDKLPPMVSPNRDWMFMDNYLDKIISKDVTDKDKIILTKDESQIKELLSVAQPYYPTTRGGYLFIASDPKVSSYIMFIPEDKAPEFVKGIKF